MHEKILVIDNDPDFLIMTQMVLEEERYVVETVDTCFKALEKIKKDGKPDLLILDVKLPVMSGVELAKILKEQEGIGRERVMFISAANDRELRILGLDPRSVCKKPFDLDPFLLQVRHMLDKIKQKTD